MPQQGLLRYGPEDVASEFRVIAPELTAHYAGLLTLASRAWRYESPWNLFQSVALLADRLVWLRGLLAQWVDPALPIALLQATKNQWRPKSAASRLEHWRQARGPRSSEAPESRNFTLHCSWQSKQGRQATLGATQLQGVLLLSRLKWGQDSNRPAQDMLAAFINRLVSVLRIPDSGPPDLWRAVPHPLLTILNQLGEPESKEALTHALGDLLPQVAAIYPKVGRFLLEIYLPFLAGKDVVWNPETALDSLDADKPPESNVLPEPPSSPSSPVGPPDQGGTKPPGQGNGSTRTRRRIRKIRILIPGNEEPLPGESPEETTPGRNAVRKTEPSGEIVRLKDEIIWARQRIWGSNSQLVRNHIESLCDQEAYLFAKALDGQLATDIARGDLESAWLGILVGLVLATGRVVRQWKKVKLRRSTSADGITSSRKVQLFLGDGVVRIPALRPEAAFTPTAAMKPLLEPTATSLDLRLPPALQTRLVALLDLGGPIGWQTKNKELKKALETYVAALEPKVGTGVSLARVRQVARACMREVTEDVAATMILCGDSFGISTAPLYYACLPTAVLEEYFRLAIWPVFGDNPLTYCRSDRSGRIGSELLVTNNAARTLARGPASGMHAAGKRKAAGRHVTADHNSLVNHIACMVIAVGGHRPTSALFELTRFDFDTALHGAVFKDKQCDPAHLCRYAPVADLVSVQVEKLIQHLQSLLELPGMPPDTVTEIRKAVSGDGPLFFHLKIDFRLLPLLTIESWMDTLPKEWRVLPLNWGRTWLASRGRDAGIAADHMAITLGHLDAAGYPFSRESPLEPAGLSRKVSGALGTVARTAGWVTRNGLRLSSREDDELEDLGALRDWTGERKALVDLAKAFELEQRRVSRATLRSKREVGEKFARSALESVTQAPIPEFEAFAALRARKGASKKRVSTSQGDVPLTLSLSDLEPVQAVIDSETSGDAVTMIAAHNALHRYLKNAKLLLEWNCPVPSPWLAPSTLEPTPFFPGLFRATAHVRILRTRFSRIGSKPPPQAAFTGMEWACGLSTIALCIFGFVDNAAEVLAILRGRKSRVRSRTVKDLILLEVGEHQRVVGLRGLAAIALSRLARDYPDEVLPSIERLNTVLAAQLPARVVGNANTIVQRLCATISVANLVELSGLARMAIEPQKGCVAMTAARQRQLLEEGHGLAGPAPAGSTKEVQTTIPSSGRKCAPSVAREQYGRLRETLFVGEGPKLFALTGKSLSQADITAFRNPLRNELEAFLAQEDLSPLVACVTAFALHMTSTGTRNKVDPAWNTVHSYVTSFGAELVALASDLDFLHLEAEEYLDIYQDVLDKKESSARRAIAARELVNFQHYLQSHHDFEVVDLSDLEDVEVRADFQVDAEIIQPQEFALGLEALAAQASPKTMDQAFDADCRRLFRQAEVFAMLLRGSGARHNELAALRFKDILATGDFVVLLIRPSRYRRLKTSSARRIVDITSRLARRQRLVIAQWIAAEKARLKLAWKPTLPILGKMNAPKERVSSAHLRDLTLTALQEAVGYRTRIHRGRHLVACEDLLAIWLSQTDWQSLRRARLRVRRRAARYRRPAVVLPRHVREHSLRFGHRRSSTTLTNYFHVPWATTSRAHETLAAFSDRHSAAVALGISVVGADKILQRAKALLPSAESRKAPAIAWVTHVAGRASATPGQVATKSPQTPGARAAPMKGRLVERVLRDIQRGLSPDQTGLVHGLTASQFLKLKQCAVEVERRTGFRIWPQTERRSGLPRVARLFRKAKPLEGILDMIDRGRTDTDCELVLGMSQAYVTWATKGRDLLIWPLREAQRLEALLTRLGLSVRQISHSPSPRHEGFVHISVLRAEHSRKFLNHELAWFLVVAYVTLNSNDSLP